ncbi:hypothetical protein QW131_17805 [Roseibium salinum]|nr:hypothetical protein [Roseibium salinum]
MAAQVAIEFRRSGNTADAHSVVGRDAADAGIPAHAGRQAMTWLSRPDATDGMSSLARRRDRRHNDRAASHHAPVSHKRPIKDCLS